MMARMPLAFADSLFHPFCLLFHSSSNGVSKWDHRTFPRSFNSDDTTLASSGEWAWAFLCIGKF